MIKDYYVLTKPGIIYGNGLTLVAGFLFASDGTSSYGLLLATFLGLSLIIASGCVFNNYIDRDIDAVMERTRKRALVVGAISLNHARIYGMILGIVGFFLLILYTNILTVLAACVGFFVYVVVYSLWLKRSSTHSALIGSISGAIPIVVGYLAVRKEIDLEVIILFFILMLWQMPHSLAIALYRLHDYKAAAIPVLPVKKGIHKTKIQILVYTVLFVAVTLLLYVFGYTESVYFFSMVVMGFLWILLAVYGLCSTRTDMKVWARGMFVFSIVILLTFCVILVVGKSPRDKSFYTLMPSTQPVQAPGVTREKVLGVTVSSSEVALLFIGDMMFDRYIRKVTHKHSPAFLFSCIDPLLKQVDLVVGNLEGPITTKASRSMGTVIGSRDNYHFTFPTTTAQMLFDHNIKVVSIGNNHINNEGKEGILQTQTFLHNAGVAYFGGLVGDSPVHHTVLQGHALSFINYNQFSGETKETVAKLITYEKSKGSTVIVYAHWGEEYKDVQPYVRRVAELFAENGADLIIGSHPHVILSHEMIGKTIVYYSLGNFIFDQYFNDHVMKGLALSVRISGSSMTIKEHYVNLTKDGRTCLDDSLIL